MDFQVGLAQQVGSSKKNTRARSKSRIRRRTRKGKAKRSSKTDNKTLQPVVLGDQRIQSRGDRLTVSSYMNYYENVQNRRTLLQQAVSNRSNYASLSPEQKTFLDQNGGVNNSKWNSTGQTTLAVNQAVSAFDTAERDRLNIPDMLPLSASEYSKAKARYDSISDKSLIGRVVDKVMNFTSAVNGIISAFGAAAGGVISQLTQGLQNVLAAFFPNQLNTMDIRQGYVGNCYLLAGINALGEHGDADTQAMLRDAVQFNPDGSIKVTFAGLGVKDWDAEGNPVYTSYTVTPGALRWFEQNDGFGRTNTPLGVRAIEIAYGMHRAGLAQATTASQFQVARNALDAGYLHEGIEALTGMTSTYRQTASTSRSQFTTDFASPKLEGVTAATGGSPVHPLVPNHAYTITQYDSGNHRVLVENPWNTSQPFWVNAAAFEWYSFTNKKA
jgi:hypothetical protein